MMRREETCIIADGDDDHKCDDREHVRVTKKDFTTVEQDQFNWRTTSIHFIGTGIKDLKGIAGSKRLKIIEIQNAPIDRLDPTWFNDVPELDRLVIIGSKIKKLGGLKGTKIESLYVENSLIEEIDPKGLPLVLKMLSLEGNPIKRLTGIKTTHLKSIKIGNTGLESIDTSSFPKSLYWFEFSGTPIYKNGKCKETEKYIKTWKESVGNQKDDLVFKCEEKPFHFGD